MTKRRRRLLAALALLTLISVLALPAVHWRLVGWARGEPFWKGRPASYYARWAHHYFERHGRVEFWVRGNVGDAAADLFWDDANPFTEADETAAPVLATFLSDPNFSVANFASCRLFEFGREVESRYVPEYTANRHAPQRP